MQSSLSSQRWAPFVQPVSHYNSSSIRAQSPSVSILESLHQCIEISESIIHDINDKCSTPSSELKHTIHSGLNALLEGGDQLADILKSIELSEQFDQDVQYGYLHYISFFGSKIQELLELRIIAEEGYNIHHEDHGIFQAIIRRIELSVMEFVECLHFELRLLTIA